MKIWSGNDLSCKQLVLVVSLSFEKKEIALLIVVKNAKNKTTSKVEVKARWWVSESRSKTS